MEDVCTGVWDTFLDVDGETLRFLYDAIIQESVFFRVAIKLKCIVMCKVVFVFLITEFTLF
jgi:hypothetical protein